MARRRSRSRGSFRARRSFSRGSRRASGRRFRGRAARAQTVRIVLEQPGANPVSRPGIAGLVGLAQDTSGPRKAKF